MKKELTVQYTYEGKLPKEINDLCLFPKGVTAVSRVNLFTQIEKIEAILADCEEEDKLYEIENVLNMYYIGGGNYENNE